MSYGAIESVVTALYEDPANAYVVNSDAVKIAGNKLKGDNIEAQLQRARRGRLWMKKWVKP